MANWTLSELPEWKAYISMTKFSIVFLCFLAVGTVFVNGLAIFAIYKDPLKCFRSPLAIFITGILLADMATGLVVEPYFAIIYSVSHFSSATMDTEAYMRIVRSAQVISSITINASFLTLLALAISQLIALGWPQRYESWITRKTAVVGTASIWLYVVFFSLIPEMFTVDIGIFFLVDLVLHTTLLTVALVVIYIVTYFIFHRAVQQSEAGQAEDNSPAENQRAKAELEKQFIKGTFILTLLLILTVWPFTIALYIWLLRPYYSIEKLLEEQIALYMCDNILFLKFLWDPVVFIWRVPKYRQAVVTVYAGLLEMCGCVTRAGPAVSYRPQRDEGSPPPQENNDVTVVLDEGTMETAPVTRVDVKTADPSVTA